MVQYEAHYLTVLLEWMPQKGVIYNVSIEPATELMEATANFSAQFAVSYHTHYNVSVEATLCGQKNVSTVILYYGEF